ncbi:CMP-sialic acid transporter [Colletotrichum gloeosporioides]|uniref:CMP-sialic acid transporter n=1 Tax=Colletotrichum gloeosporioides TaxID=474922 RepID=A0A8H4CWA8_COLGL|nr:CMP-sialic acid transporter [Colletotrichum gloeosporioides]KAF3810987.1 CMP-sialic acid transporter [Colletotrichum gloeosporioides]
MLHKVQQPSLDDRDRYEPLTAVILSETLKLIVCVVVLGFGGTPQLEKVNRIQLVADDLRDGHLKAAAPAILYTIAAVLQSLGARNLDGMSFVVLSQLKLILTPVFSVVILRQSLTMLQWLCLFTIAAGIVLVQTTASSTMTLDLRYSQDIRLGAITMLISGTCVALAGVLMESIVKVPNKFIVRNCQLAVYACLCASLSLLIRFATTTTGLSRNDNTHFFQGYHALVWVYVFLQAAGGFIVAWSVRTSSTVAKNHAQAVGFTIASIGPSLLPPRVVSLQVSQYFCWL